MRKPEADHRLVDILHADAVDDHIRGLVVADSDHQRSHVAKRHPHASRREPLQNTASRNDVVMLEGDEVVEAVPPLLHLPKELDEHRQLDGARLSEHRVSTQRKTLRRRQVLYRDADDAVHAIGDRPYFVLESRAQHFLRGLGRRQKKK